MLKITKLDISYFSIRHLLEIRNYNLEIYMKVVLLKEVKNLGRQGDIKEVKQGYARNFLIPQGLADILTKHSLNMLESQKKKQIRSKKVEVTLRRQGSGGQGSKKVLAKKINGKKFEIDAKADDKGGLYAKVDAKVIAGELRKQGYDVKVGEVVLDKVIKKVGDYEVGLKLGGEKAKVKLEVRSKK
ncbi:50S ribosomal protein L9 [Candidatus Parcubacteria bacterium]|nr:50S ribosomal protein L9 [Candidatus Parcubacteria bacterium]